MTGGPALVMLVAVGGVVAPSAADAAGECPAATVQVLETAPPGKPHRLALAQVELRLTDPKGRVVAATRPGPKEWMGPKPAQERFVEHRWALPCVPPAAYTLEARYQFRGARAVHAQRLTVGLGRGEIDVRILLGFTARNKQGKPQLQRLTLVRLLPAVAVRLRPQWTPHPDGEARYVVENIGDKPLHAVGPRGNLIGFIERFDPASRTFAEVTRGDVVPPGEPGRPIPPRGTGLAREHELAGRPARLAAGRYRFVFEYQDVPLATDLTRTSNAARPSSGCTVGSERQRSSRFAECSRRLPETRGRAGRRLAVAPPAALRPWSHAASHAGSTQLVAFSSSRMAWRAAP